MRRKAYATRKEKEKKMQKTLRKSAVLALAMIMCLSLIPMTAQAATYYDNPGLFLPGDINRDGDVNIMDLSVLLANFGITGAAATDQPADINSDGDVNIIDLSILLSNFGQSIMNSYRIVYVTGYYSLTTTGVTMDVIINGESDTINVKDRATALSIPKGLYSTLKIKGDGTIDTATIATPSIIGPGTFQNIGNLLAFNNVVLGFTAADNVPVYTFIVPAIGPVTVITGVASDLADLPVTLKAGDAVYLSTGTGGAANVANAIFIVLVP